MKTKRFQKYLKKAGKAIIRKEEVAGHSDEKIDQDFSGYPHGHAKEKIIKPVHHLRCFRCGFFSHNTRAG